MRKIKKKSRKNGCKDIGKRGLKPENLTGQKFHFLTCLEPIRISNKTGWLCKCDCGELTKVKSYHLKNGNTKSCGCYRKNLVRGKDLTGKVFSRLTVIKRDRIKHKSQKIYWICQCQCGNIKAVACDALNSGHTRSCGCIHNEIRAKLISKYHGSGPNNPRWNPDISDEERMFGRRPFVEQLRKWRIKIFKRDKYVCQISGKRGSDLQAHHIKNFSKYKKLRFVIKNGITMLKDTHVLFHKIYGKSNNNLTQVKEFKKRYNNGEFKNALSY